MHIILVSDRMATARSITLTRSHLALICTGLLVTLLALSSLFSYLTVRHAAEIRMPFLQELLRSVSLDEAGKTRDLVRDNLSSMAVRLGQLQAQLMQLDSLGEHLAGLTGVKAPQAGRPALKPSNANKGGPLLRPDNLTQADMQHALDELAHQIEVRSDTLAAIEDQLFSERIRRNLMPSAQPVTSDASASSGFGWRIDPFTGLTAMHGGIDFVAEVGTPILAAAVGIVMNVERHQEYGNMVEIDHGDGLSTRYAHAATVLVKTGQMVKRGQKIATVGSTGRSTGPHLHFEVRVDGVVQNPTRFLDKTASRLARR